MTQRTHHTGENWAIGDLAECIAPEWQRYDGSAPSGLLPQLGGVYLVSRLKVVTSRKLGRVVMLSFPEFGSETFWACGFKKVHSKGEDALVPRQEAVHA